MTHETEKTPITDAKAFDSDTGNEVVRAEDCRAIERAAGAMESEFRIFKAHISELLKEAEVAIDDPSERQHIKLEAWRGRKAVLIGLDSLFPMDGLRAFAALRKEQ